MSLELGADACLWEGVYCSNVNTTTGYSSVLGLTMSTNHLTCVPAGMRLHASLFNGEGFYLI